MTRHLFFVLFLLLLFMCRTCGPASAESAVQPSDTVALFVPKETKIPEEAGKPELVKEVDSFASPLLVAADGVMVVFAEARSSAAKDVSVSIAAKHIGTKEEGWAQKVTEGNGKNWEAQWAMLKKKGENKCGSSLDGLFSAVKGNKIYLLAVGSMWTNDPENKLVAKACLELAVGEVTDKQGHNAGKTINWKNLAQPSAKLTQEFQTQFSMLLLSRGYGLLTEDGRIVFVMGARNTNRSTVAAVIHLAPKEEETEWELSVVETDDGCSSLSLLEWKGRLIMIPTSCIAGVGSGGGIKDSADMGATWTNANGSFSRLWDNLRDRKHFTTVTIDNKTVLLFTYPVLGRETNGRYEIHLFFTDGNRVHVVGTIAADTKPVISEGLSYTNGELFSLHQQWDKTTSRTILTRLTDKLGNIKSVLKTWAERDAYLSRPCEETAPRGAPVGTLCVTPMPTDGLVGFLSGKGDATNWHDEYLYLNATVRGGTKVDNGFVFTGTNAGAEWPVGRRGLGSWRHILRHGLTVVATVAIHEVPQDDTPLLTAGGFGMKRFGLWYSSDNQWKVMSDGEGGATHTGGWATNTTYRVALVVRGSSVSAYVNGNPAGEPLQISERQNSPFGIGDFFIGGYKDDSVKGDSVKGTVSHVTVTNVLLYNRPLSNTELGTLSRKKGEKPSPGNTGDSIQQQTRGDDSNPQGTFDDEKKNSALKLTGFGDTSVHVPAAGVLLFVLSLWGIFDLC